MNEFIEYTIEGIGTIIDPQGEPGYRVLLPDGQVTAYPAISGNPCEENAMGDIEYAVENPNPPEIPVPVEVPLWAFRSVLKKNNLWTDVETLVANNEEAKNYLEYGNFILRSSPMLYACSIALGKTQEDIDNLFVEASQIKL